MVGIIDDPALAGQVSAIIAHPASAERPFLRHFLVGDGAGGGSGSHRGSGAGPSVWTLLVLIEVIGLATTLLVLRQRGRRSRSGKPRPSSPARRTLRRNLRAWAGLASVLALAAPVAAFVSVGVSSAGTVLRAAQVLPVVTHTPRAAATGTAGRAPSLRSAPSRTWAELVSIEQRLHLQHQALVAQETTVTNLTHQLEAAATPPAPSPSAPPLSTPPAPASSATSAAAPSPAAADLARIVELHQATLLAYQQTLEHEYDIFAAAAVDPARRAELLEGAASTGPADAPAAVAYDLAAVQAQTAQDTAITAAEALAQAQQAANSPRGVAPAGVRPGLSPPLAGTLTLGFGPTDLAFEAPATHDGTFYPHFHTGLDIAAPFGTPVRAAADGIVILATASVDSSGRLVGYGNYVAIAHPGGLTTVYAHLASLSATVGEAVRKGDVIGLEGTTGNSTGPHVHFETRISGGIVDPAPYLAGQIRQP